jgi:hypothetical protein
MPLQIYVSYVLYGLGFFSVGCFLFFCILYWKRSRAGQRRIAETREGIEDIESLFQTMRGVVEQQKQLAATFNEDIDKKMQMVKQVLAQSLSRNEELYEHQRLLMRELETASLEIKSIQRQIGELDEVAQSGRTFERSRRFSADRSHAERIPEAPSNPEKARDAFRLLLETKKHEDENSLFSRGDESGDIEKQQGVPSLQRQVEELHGSGMNISEIADKLGIGRGEVRLLLSLKEP